MNDAHNLAHPFDVTIEEFALPDDYETSTIESALELDELVRLRAELSWTEWKAHPRFKKDRVIREAQRRLGAPSTMAPVLPALPPVLPGAAANDVHDAAMNEADLAADVDFAHFCDERRDAWIDAIDDDATH